MKLLVENVWERHPAKFIENVGRLILLQYSQCFIWVGTKERKMSKSAAVSGSECAKLPA